MQKLAIVGASGHGKVVADLAELCGFEVTFFDDKCTQQFKVEHWNVAGTLDDLLVTQVKYSFAIIAIGDNEVRTKLSNNLLDVGFELPILIHPKATVSKYAKIASGTVVFANAVINAFARIGTNCIVNTGAVVEHDCTIGNSVHLSPNVALAGGTIVDDLAWLGIGSVTKQLVHIGKGCIVGANSTVIKNIPANVRIHRFKKI